LSAIIIDVNTSWSEAAQQHYFESTTRPRRYGRRSIALRKASIRRPIRRPLWPIARSTLRKNEREAQAVLQIRPLFFD